MTIYSVQTTLVEQMVKLVPEAGIFPSHASGVSLIRSNRLTQRTAILYQPIFYIVVQGQKTSYLGDEVYQHDPLNFLALSVPLPMEGHVTEASAECPYLAIRIDIDVAMVRTLMLQLPEAQKPADDQVSRGVCVCPMSPEMALVAGRLLACLSDPLKAAVIAPLAVQETLFYALLGPQGPQLSAFTAQGRHHQNITKVIRHIQQHFNQPIDVEQLADIANMSASSLHQHFKSVTSSSPLQYVKAMRLHQAHQMVTLDRSSISEVAYQVGYQSLSQFSREYKRLFGQMPSRSRIEAIAR